MYAYDIVTGAETEEETFELYAKSKGVFRDSTFNLQKFRSNSERLQLRSNQAEQSHSTTSQEAADGPNPSYSDESYASATLGDTFESLAGNEKVLGVQWRITDDGFVFDTSARLPRHSNQPSVMLSVLLVDSITLWASWLQSSYHSR